MKDQITLRKEAGVPQGLIDDVGANVSGQYDLVAVLTHVGRAADSGHYIGWVKDKVGGGWLKFIAPSLPFQGDQAVYAHATCDNVDRRLYLLY